MRTAVTLADAEHLSDADIFDLEGSYEEALATKLRDDRQGYFHPSGVGRCGRANVYEFIRAPFIPTTPTDSLEHFDLGHAIHALVGGKLRDIKRVLEPKKIGYELEIEKSYDPATDQLFTDLWIGGTTDGVLDVWADTWRQRSIIEIKSIKFQDYDMLTEPKEDHLMQAHLYAFRFNCPIIYMWYYCKNNSKRSVYRRVFDRKVFDKAVGIYEKLLKHVDAGTLPEREQDFYMCPRCEYRDICKPDVLYQINSKGSAKRESGLRSRGRF